jgi:hypothetical protein
MSNSASSKVLIHEAIGALQEGLHTIKNKKKDVSVFKIDLSKAF